MEETKKISVLSTDIAQKLLNSIYLLDILYDIIDGDAKECTLINEIRRCVKISFDEINECRKVI